MKRHARYPSPLALGPVPGILDFDNGHGSMGFCESAVDLERFVGGRFGLHHCIIRSQDVVPSRTEEYVRVSDSRISQGIGRISGDSLIKVLKTLFQVFGGAFVPKIPAFEV